MNSAHDVLGQKIRASHGVLYCKTALRKTLCSSRLSTVLIIGPGMGWVQHLGGILDSSVVDWLIMTVRQAWQYV
jgi:hypothetical protein